MPSSRGCVVETEPLDDAGTEVLDQHVRLGDEALHRIDVGRILEVGSEAELAAVDGVKEDRVAADLGVGEIKPTAQVAAIGRSILITRAPRSPGLSAANGPSDRAHPICHMSH